MNTKVIMVRHGDRVERALQVFGERGYPPQ